MAFNDTRAGKSTLVIEIVQDPLAELVTSPVEREASSLPMAKISDRLDRKSLSIGYRILDDKDRVVRRGLTRGKALRWSTRLGMQYARRLR